MDNTISLKDKRKLGFSEYGDPKGKPVFFFHGSGGSRLDHPANDSLLKTIGVRLITTDRPGHGLSEKKESRTLLDFADDIEELADTLGIGKFYVLGHSAGGPYALACTYKLKNRIIKCGVVSGLAPYSRPKPYSGLGFSFKIIMFIIRQLPKVNYFLRKQMAKLMKFDDSIIGEKLIAGFPPEDQKHMKIDNNISVLVNAIKEGYKQGHEGPAVDDIVINSPWGFTLDQIENDTIFWHGTNDRNVPYCQAEFQHKLIKNSKLFSLDGEAHMFILSKWNEILYELIREKTTANRVDGRER